MEFWLLLQYVKPIARATVCVVLKGIIALYAEPLVHLPLPSVPMSTGLGTQHSFEGSILLRPSITHLQKNSLALNLRCSSFRFDRPPALGRHALDLIVTAFVVEAFGYADVVASTAIRGKANALPFGACRSG